MATSRLTFEIPFPDKAQPVGAAPGPWHRATQTGVVEAEELRQVAEQAIRVLVVVREPERRAAVEAALAALGARVETASDLGRAAARAARSLPALVLVDTALFAAAGVGPDIDLRLRFPAGCAVVGLAPNRSGPLDPVTLALDGVVDEPLDGPALEQAIALARAAGALRPVREGLSTGRVYRELVEHAPIGILVTGEDGAIELANREMLRLAGRPLSDVLRQRFDDLVLNPELIPWASWRAETPETAQLWLARPDGRRIVTECRGRCLPALSSEERGGAARRLEITVEDVTARYRRLQELQLLHDLTELVATHGDVEEAFETVAGRLVGPLGFRIVGLGLTSVDGRFLEGRAYREAQRSPQQRTSVATGVTGRALRENRTMVVPDVRHDPDYTAIDPDVTSEVVAVIRAAGRPIGVLDLESDASHVIDEDDVALAESVAVHLGLLIEQVRATAQLQVQARTDPATGFPNRRVLTERLQGMATDPQVSSGALLLIDLDRFKQVNDRHGHLVGDTILQQVVERLATHLRPGDLLARFAGDEWAVVLTNVDRAVAFEVAERLRRAVAAAPFLHEHAELPLRVSIGVALYPADGQTPDALIARADAAMYVSKTHGGDAVHGTEAASGGSATPAATGSG